MRAWKRKVTIWVVCLALAAAVMPASAADRPAAPLVAAHDALLAALHDLWTGLSGWWESLVAPADLPPVGSAGSAQRCAIDCGEQSHDIDPNG